MHFVYICKDGENEELRYSIRSVLKNTKDAVIWVVGGKPNWYIGNYIKVIQDQNKYQNALNNLRTACLSDQIPENFILMNDDFYIIKQLDEIKTYHNGLLADKLTTYQDLDHHSSYTARLFKTYRELQKSRIQDPLSYELHVPMPMEKSKLINVLGEKYTILWRSAYGNRYKVGGEEIRDVKIYKRGPLLPISYNKEEYDLPYLSNADNSFDLIKDFIIANFPDKSIYEK